MTERGNANLESAKSVEDRPTAPNGVRLAVNRYVQQLGRQRSDLAVWKAQSVPPASDRATGQILVCDLVADCRVAGIPAARRLGLLNQ